MLVVHLMNESILSGLFSTLFYYCFIIHYFHIIHVFFTKFMNCFAICIYAIKLHVIHTTYDIEIELT